MFTREHLIIGAAGFVLGGVVATASIMVVLSTQKPESAVVTPLPPASTAQPTTTAAPTDTSTASATTPPSTSAPSTTTAPQPGANQEPGASINTRPPAAIPAALLAEETDRQREEARQMAQRKKSLESQVADSDEIIRLKEQQIRDMEARLKAQSMQP